MTLLRFLWAAALALAIAGGARAQFVPVPPLTGHVTDQAGMLTPDQLAKLEAVLTDYETKSGSQIAVLLVKTTEPEAIEQYGIRVVDQWKLGRKGIDDGVLLLVARDNPSALRRLRIEAGRGVQGVLTDAQSKRILQDVIAPHFRQEAYYDGLVAGVGAIATLLNKELFPAPPQQAQRQVQAEDEGFPLLPLIIGAFVLMSIFRPRRRSRLSRGAWGSGATGFILGSILSNAGRGGGFGGGFGGGGGGGGFGGGGGGFDGGGASGDW